MTKFKIGEVQVSIDVTKDRFSIDIRKEIRKNVLEQLQSKGAATIKNLLGGK